jgi:hypothetical protein
MMKRAFLLAVCVAGAGLSGTPTTAATLPKEFTGVWIAAAETDNECKKEDWKGVAGENDRLINITAKAIEEFESGCTIKSVKTSRDSPPGARTSEVNLSCSGEGMTWRSSEIWHVQNVSNRKIFTATVLRQSDYRDDFGKKMRNPNPTGVPAPRIFLGCK